MARSSSMPGSRTIIPSDGYGIMNPAKGSRQTQPRGSSPSARRENARFTPDVVATHIAFPPSGYTGVVTKP